MTPTTITVSAIRLGTDMRRKPNKTGRAAPRPGQGYLYLNRACTIARLLDSQGGLHEWRAPRSQPFDQERTLELVNKRLLVLGVVLKSAKATTKVAKLRKRKVA